MRTIRKAAGRRSAFMLAGVLATTTAAASAKAADDPLKGVEDTIGNISNAYGTFQALEFVAQLFGIGASPSVADAITQLENFMQSYRDMTLVNNVTGDLREFALISSDYMNGLTDNLESDFISRAINDFSQLQGDLNAGNMTDAYTLGPGFNLLGMTFVAGMKAFGIQNPANAYPQSQLDYYLSQMVATDYALVGAVTIDMDVGACSVVGPLSSGAPGNDLFTWTQAGKKMWPKYAAYWSQDPTSGLPQWSCAFTPLFGFYGGTCNTLSDALSCCVFYKGSPTPLPAAYREAALAKLNSDREAFLADPSVITVRTGMLGAISAIPAAESIVTDTVPTASCQGHVAF